MKNLIALCGAMIFTIIAHAQAIQNTSFFNQWSAFSETPIQWTIKTDLKQLLKNRTDDVYQAAQLSYNAEDGTPTYWKIQLKSRGNTRKSVCGYPPIKIKFKKDDLKKRGFHPINKIKMVNQCRSSDDGAEYLFKEYLAYWMYNQITPYAFKAHLAQIRFVDINGKTKDRLLNAIILEPIKDMEQRLVGTEIERETSAMKHMAKNPLKRMAIFQYMIGNTDWSVSNLHNLKIIKVAEERKVVPIPYDFDYAGIVNTDYAVPHESFPIDKVTDRLYRGPECKGGEARAYMQFFIEKEADIVSYIQNFPHLEARSKRKMLDYLDGFFSQIKRRQDDKNVRF